MLITRYFEAPPHVTFFSIRNVPNATVSMRSVDKKNLLFCEEVIVQIVHQWGRNNPVIITNMGPFGWFQLGNQSGCYLDL